MRQHGFPIRDIRPVYKSSSPALPYHDRTFATFIAKHYDTLLLHPRIKAAMPLTSSRRWLLVAITSLVTFAWFWHSAVSNRVSPDHWNRGEYADAEESLSGWRASVCRNSGLCGNWMGHGKPEGGVLKLPGAGELKRAPSYVLEYGMCPVSSCLVFLINAKFCSSLCVPPQR